jgi:hypothetical protein
VHLGYFERESLIIYRASSEVVAGGGVSSGGLIRCAGTLSGLPAGVVRWGRDLLRASRGLIAWREDFVRGHVILSGASVCYIVSQVTFGRLSQLARWILALYPTR